MALVVALATNSPTAGTITGTRDGDGGDTGTRAAGALLTVADTSAPLPSATTTGASAAVASLALSSVGDFDG